MNLEPFSFFILHFEVLYLPAGAICHQTFDKHLLNIRKLNFTQGASSHHQKLGVYAYLLAKVCGNYQ
jgi:hypothetical protein